MPPSLHSYVDLNIRIRPFDEKTGAYPVEADTDDGSHFDGELRLDQNQLLKDELDPRAYGLDLFDALFAGRIRRAYDKAAGRADSETEGRLRVRLRIDDAAAELHAVPWERLFHTYHGQDVPLAATAQTPFSRDTDMETGEPSAVSERPIRLLFAAANPSNLPEYRDLPAVPVVQQVEAMRSLFGDLRGHTRYQVTFMPGRTGLPAELAASLEREGYTLLPGPTTLDALAGCLPGFHVLHFLGHGVFQRTAPRGPGQALLLLEKDDGTADLLADQVIVQKLTAIHPQPALVFLAACESARRDPQHATLGLAPRLVVAGIPAVIAMQAPVPIATAGQLTREFYRRLLEHGVVDRAMNEARNLLIRPNDTAWAIPVLFMRLRDGQLFDASVFQSIPECPYPGMMPFADDPKYPFYGREAEIAQLVQTLRLQRFVTVIGPSGSGKSSLVDAGLLPQLHKSRLFGAGEWIIRTLRPGAQPLARLAEAAGGLFEFDPPRRKSVSDECLLLVVDQFEAVFTQAGEEAKPFQEMLLGLSRQPNVYLVLVVRSDFYTNLLDSPLWPEMQARLFPVRRLDRERLRQAIVRPAEKVEVEVEPELVERLLADAGDEPGILPFVQETLVLLWDTQGRRSLTLGAYEALVGSAATSEAGLTGLQVAMARRADAVLAELTSEQQGLARRIFLRLVQFGEGRPDTRRQQTEGALRSGDNEPAEFNRTLEHLVNARLLTADGEPGAGRRIDIAHEALFTGWPALRRWIDERRDVEQTRRRLEEKASEWQRLGSGTGGLLDEIALAEAERWVRSPDAKDLGVSHELKLLTAHSRAALKRAEEQKARVVSQFRRLAMYLVLVFGLAILAVLVAWGFFKRADNSKRLEEQARQTAAAEVNVRSTAEAMVVIHQEEARIASTKEAQEATIAMKQAKAGDAMSELTQFNGDRALLLALSSIYPYSRAQVDPQLVRHAVRDALDGAPIRQVLKGHTDAIQSAAWSPDGKQIVTASLDGTARVWDASTGEATQIFKEGFFGILSVAWSPDSKYIVTGGQDGTARVWSAATGEIMAELKDFADQVLVVAWSPDGVHIVSGNKDGKAQLWSMFSTANALALTGHTRAVLAAAWSPDGKSVVTASQDGTARVWSTITGESVAVLEGHTGAIYSVVWSPDGSQVATGSADGTVQIWDAASGNSLRLMTVTGGEVMSVAWSPDGKQIATGSTDSKVITWDVMSGKRLHVFSEHKLFISSVAWSLDGKRLLTGSWDSTAIVWNVAEGRLMQVLRGHSDYLSTATWSPDGDKVLTASQDGTARVWDVANTDSMRELNGHSRRVVAIDWSPDSTQVATGSADTTARLWSARSADSLHVLAGHTNWVVSIAWSPSGKEVATASNDGTIRLWDAISGESQKVLEGHSDQVLSLAWSPNDNYLVSGSADTTARVWDTITGETTHVLDGHRGSISSVAWSWDGRQILTGSWDGTARIWDLDSGDCLHELQGHTSSVVSSAWSRDGNYVVTGSWDSTARVWNVSSGDIHKVLSGHKDSVVAVAWSPNSNQVVTGSWDNTARLWNAYTGETQQVLSGHTDQVLSVAWSPNGQQILTAGNDGTVRVWDATSSKSLEVLNGHASSISMVAWSPNGKQALATSGSADGSVPLWILDTGLLDLDFISSPTLCRRGRAGDSAGPDG